jgi:predicted permease
MTEDRARRRYRALLRLAPPRLRTRHATDMEDAFIDAWHQARAAGGAAEPLAWTHATADLLLARGRSTARHLSFSGFHFRERPTSMLGTEIRSALRSFNRQRFATALVLLMLALGIAANVVVFSLVNGLFLKPFPFDEPDRLVYVNERAPRWNLERTGVNYPDFATWRRDEQRLAGIALYSGGSYNLSDDQGAERIQGARVTHDFFTVLRIEPLLGRMFTAAEDVPRGPRLVVISERTWRGRFGGDPKVLGRTMRISGTTFEIIGVMPQRAEFPGEVALWTPLGGDPNDTSQNYSFDAIARLDPGVRPEEAEADLLRTQAPIWTARDKEKIVSPFVKPLREEFVGGFRQMASALAAAVGLLLVVACANVAAVMLARAIARRREMGIRIAVGANRFRLLRQLFVENMLLAVLGGLAGVALGRWALQLLVASADNVLPSWATFAFDWRLASFALAMSIGTSMLFGWAPALHALGGDLRSAMQDSVGGTTVSPRGRRTLNWLVATEFTLAAVLVVGSALLVRAYDQLQRTDPGYRTDHVLMFSIALPTAAYAGGPERLVFWDRLIARIRAAPGVEAAGIVTCPPLTCHWGNFYRIEGRAPLKEGEVNPVVLGRVAGAGYFEAIGIRLASGRFFDDRDGREGTPPVVIVNEMFVRTFWPGTTDAVGQRIAFNGPEHPWMTVVGVTKDIKHYGLERPMRPGLYFPDRMMGPRVGAMAVAVRTSGDPEAFADTARALVREIDPTLPLYRVQTAEAAIAGSLRTRATYSWMLAVFACLALVLALGGTYGVTSYLVTQRTREIGIRLAMGARSHDIVRSVIGRSLAAIAIGLSLGLIAAVLTAGLMGDLLIGVSPRDPVVLSGAAAVLILAALVANWLPARRAARTDPMISLRA